MSKFISGLLSSQPAYRIKQDIVYWKSGMEQKFIFTLPMERTKSAVYWGCIAQMPQLTRVEGESFNEVGCQLVAQLGYMAEEMPVSWKLEVQTENVLHVP